MAHFAEIDENNVVRQVVVVDSSLVPDVEGADYCRSLFGGTWVQTSYNARIRKNFAGIGYTYDAARDAFIPPQPEGDGWHLDEETCLWRNPAVEAEIARRSELQQLANIGVTRV